MNSVRASNVSRRPRRVSRPRPVQPERNPQERGEPGRTAGLIGRGGTVGCGRLSSFGARRGHFKADVHADCLIVSVALGRREGGGGGCSSVGGHSGNTEASGYALAYRPRFVLGDFFCPETAASCSYRPAHPPDFISLTTTVALLSKKGRRGQPWLIRMYAGRDSQIGFASCHSMLTEASMR